MRAHGDQKELYFAKGGPLFRAVFSKHASRSYGCTVVGLSIPPLTTLPPVLKAGEFCPLPPKKLPFGHIFPEAGPWGF